LRKNFRDQGVQIISISDEDLETVHEFLKGEVPSQEGAEVLTYAQLTSSYSLTTDPDKSEYYNSMEGSSNLGLPRAFLVEKTGEIAWIGHPLSGPDATLEKVVARTWVRAAYRLDYQTQQARGWFQTRVNKLLEQGEYDSARALLAPEQER